MLNSANLWKTKNAIRSEQAALQPIRKIAETDTIYINSTDGINKTEKNTAHLA
jgi:acetamidase/formamidase